MAGAGTPFDSFKNCANVFMPVFSSPATLALYIVMEQYFNDYCTNLSGAITSSQTTLLVANTANFPGWGNDIFTGKRSTVQLYAY